MGMALHPEYDQNQYLYVCYAYPQNGQLFDRVVRMVDQGDQLILDQIIIDQIPAARFHAGCQVAFGPDDKLYVTTGDAVEPQLAQNLESLAGKVLRFNDDGSIPEDNPFANSPVYSLGHRNSQGITWHPETGQMFATEHGPSGFDGPPGGDEINLIEAGQNYGWPIVSHQESDPAYKDPLTVFTPAEAPAAAEIYSGSVFPQFRHNFFFGALRGEGLVRVVLSDTKPSQITKIEKLDLTVGRIREVTEGPDGYLYFTTSNTDGRGQTQPNDDKIYRLVPKL